MSAGVVNLACHSAEMSDPTMPALFSIVGAITVAAGHIEAEM